jgi:hypothetical protein
MVGGRARRDSSWIAEQGAVRMNRPPSWRGYMGQLWSIAAWSALPFLARIESPVLVVTGDDDPLTPVVNGMMIAYMLPNSRLLVCRGEGHLIVMDGTSSSHPMIHEFLTADELEQTKVWNEADNVDADKLHTALSSAPIQLPPLSIVNVVARRRWLPSANGTQ